ncbi:MAG: hypothetical protein Sylvanvirus17_15 [Sylvanvirus sp.]|uniref:Uncharacterized protein n=1 Tax=Sylvanvirus sp. TaxID=2487774 RepID=A0A3G5AIJ6_9VIRU|nr:MAG: hypothetical protein Sylvanvirus17_15 [Sylvanvirus sp.]
MGNILPLPMVYSDDSNTVKAVNSAMNESWKSTSIAIIDQQLLDINNKLANTTLRDKEKMQLINQKMDLLSHRETRKKMQ